MIDTIAIQGFQSIANAQLHFGRFNCIIGPSDSGKSAFIRAIMALVEARRGAEFITVGHSSASVLVGFSGGLTIYWRKTATTGKYGVEVGGQPRQEYTKYGASCPLEVETLLKLGRITVDEQVVFNPNFSTQFDPLFLITERGSAAARILSTVTNANNLMLAVREANLRAVRLSVDLGVYEKELVEVEDHLEDYIDIDNAKQRLEVIDKRIVEHCAKQDTYEQLLRDKSFIEGSIIHIKWLRSEIDVLQHIITLCERSLLCEEKAKELVFLVDLYNMSIRAVGRVGRVQGEYTKVKIQGELLERLDVLTIKFDELTTLQVDAGLLRVNSQRHKQFSTEVTHIASELVDVDAELSTYASCPLCNRPFEDERHGLECVS